MISDYRKEAEEKTGITLLDLDAIAMVPEFIAELKRCYEREDELVEILSILEDRHDIDMSQFDASE